jgi:hypothetical protein
MLLCASEFNITYTADSSSVNIMTGLWAGEPGVQFLAGALGISLLQHVQSSCVAHPPSHSMGTGLLLLGVKWRGCEVASSFPSSAKVKIE